MTAALRELAERDGHLDRVTACIAQAQGRYANAEAAGRRGYERTRNHPGDHARAEPAARDADRLARALGMAAWSVRTRDE